MVADIPRPDHPSASEDGTAADMRDDRSEGEVETILDAASKPAPEVEARPVVSFNVPDSEDEVVIEGHVPPRGAQKGYGRRKTRS